MRQEAGERVSLPYSIESIAISIHHPSSHRRRSARERLKRRTNEDGLFSDTFRRLVDMIQTQEIIFDPFMIVHHIDYTSLVSTLRPKRREERLTIL